MKRNRYITPTIYIEGGIYMPMKELKFDNNVELLNAVQIKDPIEALGRRDITETQRPIIFVVNNNITNITYNASCI